MNWTTTAMKRNKKGGSKVNASRLAAASLISSKMIQVPTTTTRLIAQSRQSHDTSKIQSSDGFFSTMLVQFSMLPVHYVSENAKIWKNFLWQGKQNDNGND